MVNLLFYALAAVAVACALGVVVVRSPMQSVLNLLGSFVCLSVIYLLMGFQFMAAVQILVYAGAIMVLFLFVVMLLNLTDQEGRKPAFLELFDARVIAALAAFFGLVGVAIAVTGQTAGQLATPGMVPEGGFDEIEALATVLFSKYMLPFEAASLLLLATMVGVMLLAKRERAGRTDSDQLGMGAQGGRS